MKGLMLFFMLFGLGVTLSNDSDGVMTKEDYVPAIELPEAVQEPVIEEPVVEEPAVKESVSYEGATYEVTFAEKAVWDDFGEQVYLAKDGLLYSFDESSNNDGFDTILTVKDEVTRNVVKTVTLRKSEYGDVFTAYVYPAKSGGYLSWVTRWRDEGADNFLFHFDADGKKVRATNLFDSYQISKGGYIYGNPASDGKNFYFCTQEYDKNGYIYGGVMKIDESLNYEKTLVDTVTASVCVGNDGIVYINDCYNGKLYSYNPDDDSLNSVSGLPDCGNYICPGRGDEFFLGDKVVYSYNTKTGTLEKLIDLSEYGYNSYYADFIYRDVNGDVSIYFENYGDSFTPTVAHLHIKK